MSTRALPISVRGFTLIELLLVIAILSIISLVIMVALNPIEQLKKANDGRRKSDLAEIQKALEIYYQDHGQYPPTSEDWIDWGGSMKEYIATDPKDPSPSRTYAYGTAQEGQAYGIFASLERGENDPQACNDECNFDEFSLEGDECHPVEGCNYGVTSPNTSPMTNPVAP